MRTLTPLAVACLFTACSAAPTPPAKTITIGAVIDRTGNNSEPSWGNAIAFAETQLNAALLKAGGYKEIGLKYKVVDSMNDPATSVSRATELVRADGAKAVILDTSQNSIAVNKLHYDADTANDLDVPLQCGGCTSGSINNPAAMHADAVEQATLRNEKGWLFKGIMSTKLISSILVKIMLETANGDVNGDNRFKVASYFSDESFGKATNNDIKAFATSLHPTPPPTFEEVSHPAAADANTYDWGADVGKLADANTGTMPDVKPDFITVANFAQQQAALVRASKNSGNTIKLLHVHTFRINSVLVNLGGLAEGEEGVSHVLLDGTSGAAFKAGYERSAGVSAAYRDAIYYDISVVFGLASLIAARDVADPAAVTGKQVRDAMLKIADPAGTPVGAGVDELAKAIGLIKQGMPINYEGASGPMEYGAAQTVRNRLARYKVTGGQFVDVTRYDCVKDDKCDPM